MVALAHPLDLVVSNLVRGWAAWAKRLDVRDYQSPTTLVLMMERTGGVVLVMATTDVDVINHAINQVG